MTETMTSAEYLDRMQSGPSKDPKWVLRGKRVQNAGKVFEKCIDAANARYRELGMAAIEKLPVATQPMPRAWISGEHQKKSGICRILSERAPFDYYGTMGFVDASPFDVRGRAVAMECKATKTLTRLPVGKKTTLKEHQLLACADSWEKFGTISVIVWKNGDERGVLLPDRILEASRKYRIGSLKSLPWDWFTPYPVRSIGGGEYEGAMIEDWLAPVISFINIHIEAADAHARDTYMRTRKDSNY